MNLEYAVERLLETGWTLGSAEIERLEDGRRYPSVLAVQQEFSQAGLELAIKQNVMFNCWRATWGPMGEKRDDDHPADESHGTVVGACARESAVYALAQLRSARFGMSALAGRQYSTVQ